MSDLESSLQKWLLIFIVGIAITVSALNYWYKVLPERQARERASQTPPPARLPGQKVTAPDSLPAAATPLEPAANVDTIAENPKPPEVDAGIPHLTLADGRTLGFTRASRSHAGIWEVTAFIHPWVMSAESGEKVALPAIPSERDSFTPVQLLDGRLALIGGRTPRDVVALESQCADCPDEYIPYGEATISTTTDVFDFETGAWSRGPSAHGACNAVMRLRDGSLLKVGLVGVTIDARTHTEILVETADSEFTRWEKSGEARGESWLNDVKIFESRTGAVILFTRGGSDRGYHWTPRGKLKPWLELENLVEVEQLDEGHLQVTQNIGDPRQLKKQIVELP